MSEVNLLKQTPQKMVEDAILAAMLTKKIPQDFNISERALNILYQSIESFQAREDEKGLLNTVVAFLVAYSIGWIDSNHPNKKVTPYSEYKSE